MLSERDKSIVYSMCMTGMSLDILKKSFPQFDGEDVEAVYKEYIDKDSCVTESIVISCNCS